MINNFVIQSRKKTSLKFLNILFYCMAFLNFFIIQFLYIAKYSTELMSIIYTLEILCFNVAFVFSSVKFVLGIKRKTIFYLSSTLKSIFSIIIINFYYRQVEFNLISILVLVLLFTIFVLDNLSLNSIYGKIGITKEENLDQKDFLEFKKDKRSVMFSFISFVGIFYSYQLSDIAGFEEIKRIILWIFIIIVFSVIFIYSIYNFSKYLEIKKQHYFLAILSIVVLSFISYYSFTFILIFAILPLLPIIYNYYEFENSIK